MNRNNQYLVSGCFHCGGAPTMYLEKSGIALECRRNHPDFPVTSYFCVEIKADEDLRSAEFDQEKLNEHMEIFIEKWDLGVDVWCGVGYNENLQSRGTHFIDCHRSNPDKAE